MFAENNHAKYYGFINRVFNDMAKKCKFVPGASAEGSETSDIVQFSVKFLDMKHFIDSARLYIHIQKIKLENNSKRSSRLRVFPFEPSDGPSLEDVHVVSSILSDLDEQMWIQTLSS